MNVFAFAASNARPSINQQLALWAGRQIPDATVSTVDLNDYELPIFSTEREAELGTPHQITTFLEKLKQADTIIIGFAEHNGTYTAAWKNLLDWLSRTEREFLYQKPVLLLATSPGGGGANSVLQQAKTSMPFFGGKVLDAISVPKFNENFNVAEQQLKPGPEYNRIMAALKTLTHQETSQQAVCA